MSTAEQRRVILIGAGGHARVCLDALLDDSSLHVVGAVSSDGSGLERFPIPMLGRDSDLPNLTESVFATTFCVAIGDNQIRSAISTNITDSGWTITQAISRFAATSKSAEIGPGAQLLPGSVVNAATVLGTGVIVNTNASIDHDCVIGDFVHVAPGVAIGGGVTVGDRALIGIGSTVLPGVSIGADAVVGAGAVVIRDVPAGATMVGNPARVLRR